MQDSDRAAKRARVLLVLASIACLVLLAGVIPSPYAVERPGPVVDVLGNVSLDETGPVPVIDVEGVEPPAEEGALNLLTVEVLGSPQHPKGWLTLLPALFDPAQTIAPVSQFYPEGLTEEQREEQNTVRMDNSQELAAAAAFRWLGMTVPVELSIVEAVPNGPAEGVLEADDRLLTVDGSAVTDFADLREAVGSVGDGGEVTLGIERGGSTREVVIVPRTPEGGDAPMIGATIASEYELPHDVDISLSRIGGPSAGLAFALGIIEQLTEEPLLDGLTVSATGTMSGAGDVGPIGGLQAKMWAADRAGTDLMLMPLANCATLPERIPDGMRIAPVATLDEAVSAIETAAAGGEPAGLERCTASSE